MTLADVVNVSMLGQVPFLSVPFPISSFFSNFSHKILVWLICHTTDRNRLTSTAYFFLHPLYKGLKWFAFVCVFPIMSNDFFALSLHYKVFI